MKLSHATLLACAIAASALPALGDEPVPLDPVTITATKDLDSVPYVDEYKVLQKAAALEGLDKVSLRFFLRAKRGDVDLATVRLRLVGATLDQEIPVASDGFFVLPTAPAAAEEGALLVSNKASGSLPLFYGPEIAGGGTNDVRYGDLMEGMTQSTKMMKKLWGFLFPSFVGVSVRFDRPGQSLSIASARVPNRIVAENGDTFVVLEYDENLDRENPEVRFSRPPLRIVPVNTRPRRPTGGHD